MSDAEDMYEYSRDPEVARHVLWDAHTSIHQTRNYLRFLIRQYRNAAPGTFAIALRDSGNNNARLTLYSPEELQKYDIAITPDLPYKQLFGENHASWVLTYHNEYGAMSWLLNQTKDD
jgi:hypothetical protein